MKLFYEVALRYIKSRLFGPKEYFERVKGRLVGRLFVPLLLLVGAPSLILSVLSSFSYIDLQGQGVSLQLVGEASSDVLVIATSVSLAFVFALGLNLLYAFRIRKTEERLASLEAAHKLDSAFEELKMTYYTYLGTQDHTQASMLGSYICRAFPQQARLEPDFIKSLVDISARLGLDASGGPNLLPHGHALPFPSSDGVE